MQVAVIFAPVVSIGRACTLRPPVVSGCKNEKGFKRKIVGYSGQIVQRKKHPFKVLSFNPQKVHLFSVSTSAHSWFQDFVRPPGQASKDKIIDPKAPNLGACQ